MDVSQVGQFTFVETLPGAADFDLFDQLPKVLYPDTIHYHLHGLSREHLYSCLVIHVDEEVKGRLAIYFNPQLTHEGKRTACIGSYECVEDSSISRELLNRAFGLIREAGVDYVIVPMSGSTWYDYRFSLDHDSPNFFSEPYHHLYYNQQFLDVGFAPIATYYSSLYKGTGLGLPDVSKVQERLKSRGVVVRKMDKENYEADLPMLHAFCSAAFKPNFLYAPISLEGFKSKYVPLKDFIDSEYVLYAMDGEELVGLVLGIHDHYNKSEKSLIIKTLARKAEAKYSGLGALLVTLILGEAAKGGYQSIVHALMMESNDSVKTSGKFFGEVYKHYALYGKEL